MAEPHPSLAEPLMFRSQLLGGNRSWRISSPLSLLIGLSVIALLSWRCARSGNRLAIQDSTMSMVGGIQPYITNRLPSSAWQAPFNRLHPQQRVVKAQSVQADTWQTRLDKALLNVDVDPRERLNLLSQVVGDPMLSEDVRSAVSVIQEKGFGKGHPEAIDKLWPKGTTARADLEGLTALRKQVPEVLQDVQMQLQQPNSLFPQSVDGQAPPLPDANKLLGSLATLARDRKKQEELLEEAKDLLRSTPKGLETPHYTVVRMIDGPLFLGKPEPIELRAYEEFSIAQTNTEEAGFTSKSSGAGFNTLASYLFGKNEAKQEMAMTMPVEMKSHTGASQGSMAFVLPSQFANDPPAPLPNSSIVISKVPARLVVAKPFAGIVTDEEVKRQKASLLEALAADGSVVPVDQSEVTVLQYNSPLTIPWRRRNEIAMVVTEKATENTEAKAETDAKVNATDAALETGDLNDDGKFVVKEYGQ